MCERATVRLDCRPESAAAGRHFVSEVVDQWLVPQQRAFDTRDDLRSITGELVANAARFCSAPMTLTVSVHRDRVDLAVTDDCPEPAVVGYAGPGAVRGRGLAIVAALSSSWGQTTFDGASKAVWCVVALPAGAVRALECSD
ncbi:MAG: ATP-binding protein [Acidimicrobiales bacterium]